MVMIVFPPPFQGGGIQHPSSARRRRAGGGGVKLPYRYHWDTRWAFTEKKKMYIRLLMSDIT